MSDRATLNKADPPDIAKLPPNDIIGVTVILLKCSYLDREFVRVGYYVNNEYMDEALKETPPPTIQFDKLYRNILSEKPRVTRWAIAGSKKPLEPTEHC